MRIAGIEVVTQAELGAMIGTRAPSTISKFIKRHQLQATRYEGRLYYARPAIEAAQRAEMGLPADTASIDIPAAPAPANKDE